MIGLGLASAAVSAEEINDSSVTNQPSRAVPAKPLEPIQPALLTPRIATPAEPTTVEPGFSDSSPADDAITALPGSQPKDPQRRMREALRRATVQDFLIQQNAFRSQEVARAEAIRAELEPDEEQDQFKIEAPILFNTEEADAILAELQVFPSDNLWNQDITGWRIHSNSANIIASIGAGSGLTCNYDMGFVIVPPKQTRVPVKITMYPKESDPGPFPVPDNAPIEGWPIHDQNLSLAELQADKLGRGGDRHVIVLDPVRMILHEFFATRRTKRGWEAGQASTFNLNTNQLRPDGWTSADAAGLPIFPAVVRYDELSRGVINHALRVTVPRSRRAYVPPATHFASRHHDVNLPRMGERLRLRADYPIERFSPAMRTILTALKTHGMFVADNGNWFAISITPDRRIPDLQQELKRVSASDFQVVVTPPFLRSRVTHQEASAAP